MTRQTDPQPGHPATSSRRNGGGPLWHGRPREQRTRARTQTRSPRPARPQADSHSLHGDSALYAPITPPGIIGGAIIHATRRAAKLTQRALARIIAVTPGTIRGWEDGTIPLFAVPYEQIRQLAWALTLPGTQPELLTELIIASQCDLLITRMLDGTEDYAEPPPIDDDTAEDTIARALLRWALTGTVPAHHEGHARPGPLTDHHVKVKLTDLAQQLAVGEHGPYLIGFGIALTEITSTE